MSGYREDLAYIHDVGFSAFAEETAPGLLAMLPGEGRVVDLGCGSGAWAKRLVRAGYEVVGIDQSAAMIALARARVPKATFRRGSFVSAPIPRCDAVTALGEVFNYLFDPRANEAALERLFARVHAALRPGGVFIFDMAGPGRARRQPAQGWMSGKDWALMIARCEENGEVTRSITAFRKVGRHYRRSDEEHRLRLYPPAEVLRLLRRAGFRARVLRSYGDRPFPPGHAGFLARKPLQSG